MHSPLRNSTNAIHTPLRGILPRIMNRQGGGIHRRGSAPVGLLVFVLGVAMIGFAFYLAYQIFLVPPSVRLEAEPGKPIDIGTATESLTTVLVRLLLLVAMAGFGSMIANRGIKLYASNSERNKKPKQEKSETVDK